jgi:hypothetical protein
MGLPWRPESPGPRLLLAIGDATLEARVEAVGAAVVGTVRDAADLRRHARAEVAEGVVLSARLSGAGPELVAALPSEWWLLVLPGGPGRMAATLAVRALRRPRSGVSLGSSPWALARALSAVGSAGE